MKILSCMYGGEYGYTALRMASKIAKATDSELTLMYVVDKIPDRFATRLGETAAGPGETIADLYQNIPDLKDTIFENAEKILEKSGIIAEKEFVTGHKIADAILEKSDEGYDLVVLGSGGFAGLERMLFGSVSYQVAEHADVPVLVVKQSDDNLKNILVCTDGSESAKSACLMGAVIAKAVDAKVALLTVAQEFLDEEHAKACDIECSSAIKEKVGIDVERVCKAGKGIKSVRDEINRLAPKYDLIVVGSRGLSRLERVRMGHVSLSVNENADSNVLIVRGYKH